MEKKILIIDIETTGFLQAGGKIVEIGIVELDLNNGKSKIIFDKVMHEKGITKEEVEKAWIISNSSLTVEMIQLSKNLESYRDEIQQIIYKYPLGATAFNNKFDFGFMENRGFEFPEKLGCPMLLSQNIVKARNKAGRIKWPKVEEAYKHFFGDGYVEEHRGADDALHEAEIVHELYLRGVFKVDESKITKLPEAFESEPAKTFEFERADNHDELIKFLRGLDKTEEFTVAKHAKITNVSKWAESQCILLDSTKSQHQYDPAIKFVLEFKEAYEKT